MTNTSNHSEHRRKLFTMSFESRRPNRNLTNLVHTQVDELLQKIFKFLLIQNFAIWRWKIFLQTWAETKCSEISIKNNVTNCKMSMFFTSNRFNFNKKMNLSSWTIVCYRAGIIYSKLNCERNWPIFRYNPMNCRLVWALIWLYLLKNLLKTSLKAWKIIYIPKKTFLTTEVSNLERFSWIHSVIIL